MNQNENQRDKEDGRSAKGAYCPRVLVERVESVPAPPGDEAGEDEGDYVMLYHRFR